MDVILKHEPMTIPTYVPYAANTLPFFLEKKAYQGATGRIYPVPYTDRLSNKPVDKEYDSYTLENEHVKVVLLPELGGKIHGAVDKHNNYEFIYQNTVIKPAMVGHCRPVGVRRRGVQLAAAPPPHHLHAAGSHHHRERGRLRDRLDGRSRAFPPDARHGGHHCVPRPLLCGGQGRGLQPHRLIRCPLCGGHNLAVRVHTQYKAHGVPAGCRVGQRP